MCFEALLLTIVLGLLDILTFLFLRNLLFQVRLHVFLKFIFQILFSCLLFVWHIIFHPIFFHFSPSDFILIFCPFTINMCFIFQAFLLWTTWLGLSNITISTTTLSIWYILCWTNGWIYDYHISICFLFILCIIVSLVLFLLNPLLQEILILGVKK